jgi:tRNA U34 2-thiouridine synthase MnmA/TrmU
VGPRTRLERSEIDLRDAVLHVPAERVEAKLRARSPAAGARVEPGDGPGRLRLHLDEAAYGVARGQTAVLYDGHGAVVGAGVVD